MWIKSCLFLWNIYTIHIPGLFLVILEFAIYIQQVQHKYDTSATNTTQVQHKYNKYNTRTTSTTQVQHKYNKYNKYNTSTTSTTQVQHKYNNKYNKILTTKNMTVDKTTTTIRW